jgi:hypothetical protein
LFWVIIGYYLFGIISGGEGELKYIDDSYSDFDDIIRKYGRKIEEISMS